MKASNWISDIAKQAAPLTHFIISWETHKRKGSVMAVVGQQQLAALPLLSTGLYICKYQWLFATVAQK